MFAIARRPAATKHDARRPPGGRGAGGEAKIQCRRHRGLAVWLDEEEGTNSSWMINYRSCCMSVPTSKSEWSCVSNNNKPDAPSRANKDSDYRHCVVTAAAGVCIYFSLSNVNSGGVCISDF